MEVAPGHRPPRVGFNAWLERMMPALAYYSARFPPAREAHEAILALFSQRAQREAIRRWGERVSLKHEGIDFAFDLRNSQDLRMFCDLVEGGGYEPGTSHLLRRELHDGVGFVDVGANIGYFTLLAMSLVGPAGHVWAFEPNPDAFVRLRENVALNGGRSNVELFPFALGAVAGRRPLFLSRYLNSRSSFTQQGKSSIEVRVERADSVLGDCHIDCVKVDAEGAELLVLEGFGNMLEQRPDLRLFVEWTWRYSSSRLWGFLNSHFRRIAAIRESSPEQSIRVRDESEIRHFAGNLVCDNRTD